ncbi:YceI family protein [Actinomadura sp. DC4]|uniref:YceI family protein n=1 Tax=Actinomadura sp. DC4 TaxID=3055069 RepID=UPI0025AFF2E9|nr:YceI family protein [Actinomadura sp. DC4]MDN3356753.1 YceI family protein [Actinomadura sp. DC4]
MALTGGSFELGPASGRLLLRTGRSGLGRRAGHDLTLEAARWSAQVSADLAEPAGSSVTAEIEAGSLEVREGTGGVLPLTDHDRSEIVKNIRGKVLHTSAHPAITFRSTSVEGTPESFTVEGDLTIMGVTRPVTVRGRVTGDRLTGGTTVVQSRWGIKPYSAMFGQLRVADPIEIEFDLTIP